MPATMAQIWPRTYASAAPFKHMQNEHENTSSTVW